MILNGEAENIEYKQEYSKTILKTVCSYANFHDGYIVEGIKDDGTIVGIDMIDELKLNIENAINDSILPKPYYEFEVRKVDESELLTVKVYKGDHTSYIYKNKAYITKRDFNNTGEYNNLSKFDSCRTKLRI